MNRLMGLETEYGLFIEGVEVGALTTEARALVESGPGGPRWDYRGESPLQDLRGFRAPRLITNPRDEEVERTARPKAPEPRTPHEDHVDRVLLSGARFYHDHGHPEYSTPECRTLKDLLTHDRAGEQVVWAAARAYTERTGRRVWLYKNNSDYHGMSYGCHENYLVKREIPWEHLVAGLLPFLVTRVLFAGAGKVGAEAHVRPDERIPYQLSQRADFFDEILGVDTLHRRPLINTRDEPHCDPRRWRRLHVICGDANLSEYSTALKLGTTALVLGLLERGYGPPIELKDPVRAVRELSRSCEGGWLVETRGGKTIPAVDVQRAYLLAARELAAGRDSETDWLLRQWETVLDDLEGDPRRLRDRLDWAAKRALLEDYLASEGRSWETADLELLQSLELEYHNIDPQAGLFWALQDQGAIRRITKEKEIERARQVPPRDTRACLRGLCLRRFEVEAAGWSRLVVRDGGLRVELDLSACVDGHAAFDALSADATLHDVVEWIAQTRTRTETEARR